MSDKNDLSKIASTAPDHIWLDLGEEAHLVDDETTFKDLAGVTWSEDNATGQGIKYLRADTLSHPATQAGALQAVERLAPKHTGMRVDYSGLLKQAQSGLRREPALAEMIRQLKDHMTELGRRWYAGDTAVVDEILQLYCVEQDARKSLAATQPNASCDHEWVSMRNKVITSGEICAKLCGAIRPEQPNAAPGDGHVWLKCDGCGKDMRSHDRMGHCPAPGDGQGALPFPNTDDPVAHALFWLDSALRCQGFHWDGDQWDCAQNALQAALAAPGNDEIEGEQEEPVAWFAFGDSNGPVPLELYGWDKKACLHAVLENARATGWKGTVNGYLFDKGWRVRPVYLHPLAAPSTATAAREQEDKL